MERLTECGGDHGFPDVEADGDGGVAEEDGHGNWGLSLVKDGKEGGGDVL